MKKLFMLLTVVSALNLQNTSAHAIPLGILVGTNGQIVQGDKRFTNFKLSNITIIGPASGDPALNLLPPNGPGQIEIQGFTNLIGEHGLKLLGLIQANTTPGTPLAELRFSLEYDVNVTDPLFLIHDVRHAFSFASSGMGSLNLLTQAGSPPNVNASIQSVEGFGNAGVVNEDEAFLNDVSSEHMLHVIDFRAETTTLGGVTVFGDIKSVAIDLTFSQIPIPEPSTWLLLGTGIAGLALWRRHKKS